MRTAGIIADLCLVLAIAGGVVLFILCVRGLMTCAHPNRSTFPLRPVKSTNCPGDELKGEQVCLDCGARRQYTLGLPEHKQGPWMSGRSARLEVNSCRS